MRTVLLGAAALLALARPAAGQTAFDADDELQGFSDMRAWHQAWMLRPFLQHAGKKLSPAERAAVQAEWKTARPKIEARHAAAENDPFLARTDQIRTSVARQPFYADLQYRVQEETRPVALFVEVPGRAESEDALRAQRVAEAYAPFLAAFLKKLDAEIAPLVGAPPKTSYVVWVLQDEESYARFFKEFGEGASVLGIRAHYSTQQRWAFTWSPSSTAGPEFLEGVQSLLHELTHAYLDALVPGGLAKLRSHWVSEGLPEYYSCWKRSDKEVFFDPLWSERVRDTLERLRGPRGELRVGFADWVAMADGPAVWRKTVDVARKRAGGADAELVAFLMSRFYAEAFLFVLWLHETREGKYRDAFREYLALELKGQGGFDVFKTRLGEVLELPIETELELYARELLERRSPREAEATRAAEAAAAKAASLAAEAPRFVHVRTVGELVSADAAPTIGRALAWRRFVDAGLRGAAEAFGAAPGVADDAALCVLVERQVEALLARLQQGGAQVLFTARLRGRVVEYDAQRILVDYGSDRSSIARAEFAPARVAFALRAHGEKDDATRAAATVLELIGGDPKKAQEGARKVAGEHAARVKALLAEGEKVLREIAAATALDAALRAEPAQFEAALREGWQAAQGSALSFALRAPLRELAAERLAQGVELDAVLAQVAHVTNRVVAPGPDGTATIALEWSFDRPEEGADFVPKPWPELLEQFASNSDRKLGESKAWSVAEGRLVPAPGGFLELPLSFAAGARIEFELRFDDRVQNEELEASTFWIGLRVDGSEDLLLTDWVGRLIGFDRGRPDLVNLPVPSELRAGSGWQTSLEVGPLQTIAARGEATARLPFRFDGLARLVIGGSGTRCFQLERLLLRAPLREESIARLKREHAQRLAEEIVAP